MLTSIQLLKTMTRTDFFELAHVLFSDVPFCTFEATMLWFVLSKVVHMLLSLSQHVKHYVL